MNPVIEPLRERKLWEGTDALTQRELDAAFDRCLEQIDLNLGYFGSKFPKAAAVDGVFPLSPNKDWTEGFWTGMLWLAYQRTGDERYSSRTLENVRDFARRLDENVVLDHHDLGFLYTPSCVAAYKLTGDALARATALRAAERLATRWQPKGRFIQAWGPMDSPEHYRFIVDCLMNIPLLTWAARETGDETYEQIAKAHFETTCKTVIRPDASTFHTFYMDPATGAPDHGATRQGYADDSSWARGQAWAVYGIPLNTRLGDAKPEATKPLAEAVSNYFLNRLPADHVCYWDLIFSDGDGMPRDSSAAAIAACGFDEFARAYGDDPAFGNAYRGASAAMLRSLVNFYVPETLKPGAPLLGHAVYSWHEGKGVDEGCSWGDYFYLEALTRASGNWDPYW